MQARLDGDRTAPSAYLPPFQRRARADYPAAAAVASTRNLALSGFLMALASTTA
jgi:hypothetical protein